MRAGLVVVLIALCLSAVAFAYEPSRKGIIEAPTESIDGRLTASWAVHVEADADPDAVAAAHGMRNAGPVGTLRGWYEFVQPKSSGLHHRAALQLEQHPAVRVAERQVIRQRVKRNLPSPSDPLYSSQWHLHGTANIDVNPHAAWSDGITGDGVQIAVVDDGLQHSHPDFASNYAPDGSYDFNYHDSDPTPFSYDAHGTESAGTAAAGDNSVCGTGVAPRAKVSGIRLIAAGTTDAQEASGLSYKTNVNDIFTCSWGPYDDAKRLEGPGRVLKAALEQSVEEGRDGKGSVYMWAGGNGRGSGDNCNYDGYANSRFTNPIGAIQRSNGRQTWYSESCSCLMAVVPSSGSGGSIVTTDLMGSSGSSYGDCSSSFGGTSAASPMAAGIVALWLQARPELTWRDVQHVMANCALPAASSDPGWVTNGAGYSFNHAYGFGRLDATHCVSMAQCMPLLPAEAPSFESPKTGQGTPIPESGDGVTVPLTVANSGIAALEFVELCFSASIHHRGELSISLISPAGTESELQLKHGDTSANYPSDGWCFGTVAIRGEAADGEWSLLVKDNTANNSGATITWFQLKAHGTATVPSRTC